MDLPTQRQSGIMLIIFTVIVCFSGCTGEKSQKLPAGYPDKSPGVDLLPGFKNPPEGYGEVSFYWWQGDTLTKDRIISQLDQLANRSITGLQINYCHTDTGGVVYGRTYPSQPALFSDKWWELFQWFLKEAKKRGMSVSLSDYTLGAAGQGWYIDEILKENPHLHGSKLELKQLYVKGNQNFRTIIPDNTITTTAFKDLNGILSPTSRVDLNPMINNSELNWETPPGKWKIFIVYKTNVKTSYDPMNPLSGSKMIEKFFQRFEDHCPGESGKGLNFFFSDELQFGIRGFLWDDNFANEFRSRKGYDILNELPHLFVEIGPRSYKVRLDYNDVMVALTEEGYFKPLYDWHTKRGMLYGCDHGGRGTDVTEFGDYFRTQRWMSGPGCDQPYLASDIVKNKVASSIAHLYERPRTWLEAFYGSGWGTSSEEVANAIFANYAMGQNMLSFPCLHYSTHGSLWEWAPPDHHFRQPYWQNMDYLLKCTERLSYVLSQGYHRCDIALIYPVAPVEANLKGKESVATAFSIARDLYPAGLDFDFMDFESLARSEIKDKELNVSGERYKVLILPSMSAIRYSNVEKALDFYRAGGIVIAAGSLPEASDRIGGNDDQMQSMIKEMFGTTFSEKHDTTVVYSQKSKNGGAGIFISDPLGVKNVISSLIQPDFKVVSGNIASNILHRRAGKCDLYFVYGVPKGTECFFRCSGKVELWDPWDGSLRPLKVSSVSETGTTIRLPLEKNEPQLIVFSEGKPEVEENTGTSGSHTDTLTVDNTWEFELKPTLDNRYGDCRLPAFEGKLGVEIWKMKFAEENSPDPGWQDPHFDDSNWKTVSVSYGPQFWKLGPLPGTSDSSVIEAKLASLEQIDIDKPVEIKGRKYFWEPYEFSWRWGLKDDPGHQGYHGMKGKINNELISLGKINKTRFFYPVYPLEKENEGSDYYLWSTVSSPDQMTARINIAKLSRTIFSAYNKTMDYRGQIVSPQKVYLNHTLLEKNQDEAELRSGSNPVLLKYNKTGRGYYIFENSQINIAWKQSIPLATEWYLKPSVLPFNYLPQLKDLFGWYRFMCPPGARTMIVQSVTKPKVWIGGNEISCGQLQPVPVRMVDKNMPVWKIDLPDTLLNSSLVALRIELKPGFYGGAAVPEPVLFDCGKGKVRLGDLNENESLKTYSGGMWYRKTVNLTAEQVSSPGIILDLGRVVASAEVVINGKPAGIKVASPWKYDITDKLRTGQNRIEVLVYNTLGNHYLTTPSMYVGRTNSGMMGPVIIEFHSVQLKK